MILLSVLPIPPAVIDIAQDGLTLETKRLHSPCSVFPARQIGGGVKGTACQEMRLQQLCLQMTSKDELGMVYFFPLISALFCAIYISFERMEDV